MTGNGDGRPPAPTAFLIDAEGARQIGQVLAEAAAVNAAARRWVAAQLAVERCDTFGAGRLEVLLEVDAATHALIAVLGEPCPYCDAGTCPAVDVDPFDADTIDTPPL
jgi:hypothetical protein